MPLFHFSCGNSSRGTIGFCANVRADNKKMAVERLQSMLPLEIELRNRDLDEEMVEGEYVSIYLNVDAISVRQIDAWEDDDTDKEDDEEEE